MTDVLYGKKAAIFDLDGVIVDTARYHYMAWKKLAARLGFAFTGNDNEALKGVSRIKSLEILLRTGHITVNEEEKARLADLKNKWYVEFISQMNEEEILKGAKEFLVYLKGNGVKTALGSASKNAPLILERLNLIGFFDAVADGNMVSRAKPDPEVFLKAAEMLNIDPEDCVVFEDAIAGIEAAKNANMKVVGVGDPDVLNMADAVVPGLHALLPG